MLNDISDLTFLKKINYKQATTHFKMTITPFSPTAKTIVEHTLAGLEIFGVHTGSRENIHVTQPNLS